MFKVRSLANGEVRTVYAVSGTHFLLWHGGGGRLMGMKCVLASIKPKWCRKIESKEKKAEVRKTVPLLPTPFKVYIYCTQGAGADTFNAPVRFETIRDDYIETGSMDCINSEIGNGKVVGEFICEGYDEFPVQSASMRELSELSCVPVPELYKYAGGNSYLYGWYIKCKCRHHQSTNIYNLFQRSKGCEHFCIRSCGCCIR